MERLDFSFPAGPATTARARVGVVGSGDLEVLLEPAAGARSTVRVTTSVDGYGAVWQAQLDRLFDEPAAPRPAVDVEINDFGATPGVVGLRVRQAFDVLARAAGGGAR